MKTVESSSKCVENTAGKGEIARYEQFLLFPSVFKRLVLLTHKNQGLFGKGLTKLKASAYDEFDVDEMMISVFDRLENMVGKEGSAS